MTEDDRTIDADDDMLDELRRLAADARAEPDLQRGSDETIDADESTMDLLRQFASEVRADLSPPQSAGDVDPDQTPPGGLEALPIRDFDPPADRATAVAPDPGRTPAWEELPPTLGPDQLPRLDGPPVEPSQAQRSSLPPLDGLIQPRIEQSTAPAPAPSTTAPSWRPPPRMVMPAEPERAHRSDSHRWRAVSLALGVVLIVVLGVLAYTALTGDDNPSDDVPEELPIDGEPLEPGAPPEGSEGG